MTNWIPSPLFRPRAISFPSGALSVILFLAGTGRLDAQQPSASGVSIPTNTEYKVLWQRMERAQEKGNWDAVLEGLALYVELVERPEINTVVSGGGGTALGIRRILERFIDALPPDELRRYRTRLNDVLTRAWNKSRLQALPEEHRKLRHRLLRDYKSAETVPAALKDAIDEAFEAGSWLRARDECERLLTLEGSASATQGAFALTEEDYVRALVLLSQACQLLGDVDAAKSSQEILRRRFKTVDGDISEDLRTLVSAHLGAKVKGSATFGGKRRIQESALEPLVPPFLFPPRPEEAYRLGRIIWERRVHGSSLRPFVSERSKTAPAGAVPLPYYAVASGGVIVFRHADRLAAYDANARRTRWSLPLNPAHEDFGTIRSPLLALETCYYTQEPTLHAVRLDTGKPLWKASFYYDNSEKTLRVAHNIPEPDETPSGLPEETGDEEGDEAEEKAPEPDASEEELQAEKKESSSTAIVLSLSPPALYGDRLLVSVQARIGQEVLLYLVCLDSSGEEIWTTFLGSSQGVNYLGLAAKNSVPLVNAGTIYQLSNTGMLAALDAEDGTILWINEYQSLTSRGTREAIRQENRWQPNPVLPVGPNLLIAPQDSPYLIAVQKTTGALAWRIPRAHEAVLVGATGKACFLVGKDVSAIGHSGVARGRLLWRFRLGSSGFRLQPLGRSLLTHDSLLIPCRTALISLSLTDGSVLSQTLWDFTAGGGGNLLLAETRGSPGGSGKKSVLAVTNPSGILVYNHLDVERARIEGLPPDDTESLLQRAKFHLKNSEIESSLAVLRSWLQSDAPAPQPNSRLDHLHLDLAEMIHQLIGAGEAEAHSEELLRYRVHLEGTPRRKVEAAIALADKLEESGKPEHALEALHQALAFDNPATDYSPDGLLSVLSATYLRERILDLRKKTPNPEQTFSAVDAEAREALRNAQQKTTTALLEVIRLYPFTPAVARAYLDLSLRFRDRQSYDQAIKALEGYIADYPQGSDVITAKLFVANLLYQSGRGREARACYLNLLEHHPSSLAAGVPGTRKGETVEEYVRPLIGDPGLRQESVEEYRTLRFPIQMQWRSPADLQALKRTFLVPTGTPPGRLKKCFLTQSEDTLELRDAETGLPVWKVYLEMIPGFESEPYPFGRSFHYPRPRLGRRAFAARYVRTTSAGETENEASLLVLHDTRNILAVDALKGVVRWHVPIGPEREIKDPKRPQLPQLRETLWGVAITEAGVFALTSRSRLRRYNERGEFVWETELAYTPAPHKHPIVFGGNVFVHARPSGVHVHDAKTGDERPDEAIGPAEGLEKLGHPPIELVGSDPESPSGRVLLASSEELTLLDLETRTILWSFSQQGKHREILEIAYDPEFPGECIVFVNRANNWPAMVSISLGDGVEQWRYEKFPAAKANFSVVRDRNRFYTTRTRTGRGYLLAIQVRQGVEVGKPIAQALWPSEVSLVVGRHRSASMKGRLHVGGDSVFFTDQGKVFVYDKLQGVSRTSPASVIDKFLVEKKECSAAVIRDRLILLTDGGDCSFGPQGAPASSSSVFSPGTEGAASRPSPFKGRHGEDEFELLQRYQANPGALESTAHLALQYFRDGELGAAISLLNQALVSEDLLLEHGTEKRFLLSYLLDGIKEEYMKRRVPKIKARRFRQAPAVDGELNDAWDVASRTHLSAPKNLGTIPGPGHLRDWEGEEDLSAVLYTGWDEKYFYFALDVTDDVLYPYDRDADHWRGDCLLIGLDPTGDGGYKQRGSDQLMTLALTVPKRNKRDKQKDNEGEEGEEEGEEEDEDEKKPKGLFSVRKKDDNSGAIYEVGLPWSSFSSSFADGYVPPPGFAFGLSLLLTDDDTGQGATKTLSINPCHLLPRNQKNSPVWRFIIPYFFPRVTLE